MSSLVYIGLGANVGDIRATLIGATQALSQLSETTLEAMSPWYRTAPIEATGPDFVNAVAQLRTDLSPQTLLCALQQIEQAHGRVRPYRNAPRTLDLDILLYGDLTLQTPTLTLPHPKLHERAFALVPLADLAPGACIPGWGLVSALLPTVAKQAIGQFDQT
jgi:2-amino-4-hydroxy-6-hydroxymethyldihydropteridine diphosphokinase